MATTYYFPDSNGLGAADPAGNGSGQDPYTGTAQYTGGYTKVVVNSPNNGVYTVTFNYDDPVNAPVTATLYQTAYTSTNFNETTNAAGTIDYLTSNNAVTTGKAYNIPSNGTEFTPDAQYLIDPETVCFASGTLIRTGRGDVAVETLEVGDQVITSTGALRPIRWLGHRTVECARHPRPSEALPIKIAAHAFGLNHPSRDLVVSPGHSICVDIFGETLIPAASLINGATITQMAIERVTYWHVELDSHDVLLAENLPAESYLEMGNRGFFAESGVVSLAARPDASIRTHADFCRPFVNSGPLLHAVRLRLAVRAERLGATGDRIAA